MQGSQGRLMGLLSLRLELDSLRRRPNAMLELLLLSAAPCLSATFGEAAPAAKPTQSGFVQNPRLAALPDNTAMDLEKHQLCNELLCAL
jgi:hypothetical protein